MRRDDVRNVVEQASQVAGQVGVPGVRVDQVHLRNGCHHGEVGAEHTERSVGSFRIVLGVRGGALARLAHALDVDIDELAQLRHQLGDVDPSTTVDRGDIPGSATRWTVDQVCCAIVGIVPQRRRC